MAKIYNLFISHSWSYGDAYEKLRKLLDADRRFSYRDYSVPKNDPVHNAPNVQALYDAIKQQIVFCHVVVIMAGKYATYSKWIQREIQIAKRDFSKPVVAVAPWGAQQISSVVQANANRIARWNTPSIVGAIREVA